MNNLLLDQILCNTSAITALIAEYALPFHKEEDQESASIEIGVTFEFFESDMSDAEAISFGRLSPLEKAFKFFETVGYPPPPTDESTTFLDFDETDMIISFAMYKNRSARSIFLFNLPKDAGWLQYCQATAAEAAELIRAVGVRRRHA